jgi:hypothetical protein
MTYPTTVIERGYRWSIDSLREGFDENADMWAWKIVARFHQMARKLDPSIRWSPDTSEVIADCWGETTAEHSCTATVAPIEDGALEALRVQAGEDVYEEYCS